MTFESQREQESRRRSREAVEGRAEIKESKENEMDEEAKAAATMERADLLVKEVKQGKQQMQNIMVHMQQVLSLIAKLRTQLQLKSSNDDPSSVAQDQKRLEKIKKQIAQHKDELLKMKDELIDAQAQQIREGQGAGMSDVALRAKAEEMVEKIMEEIEN